MSIPPSQSIQLDTPIGDIYKPLCRAYNKRPVLYLYPPIAFDSASKETNSSNRFLYQATLPGYSLSSVLEIFSQPIAFCSGPVDVLICEDSTDDTHRVERTVRSLIDSIAHQHRPKLHFLTVSGNKATHDAVKNILGSDGMLITNRPDDWCEGLPVLVDLDTQYKLESKLVLHESPIPSPNGEVLWLNLAKTTEGEECWRDIEAPLTTKPLPFVVKMTHAGGGHGVFIAKDEQRRQETIKGLKALRKSDQAVYDGNFSANNTAHHGTEIIPVLITDYLEGPTLSIVFSVTYEAENPQILGIMEQVLLSDGISWEGVRIDYEQQDKLKAQYADLIQITSRWMHSERFRGLACVDFLLDQNNEPRVVDLNPRFGGAAPVCFVRSHFQARGRNVVVLTKYKYPRPKVDAKQLIERLSKEMILVVQSLTEMTPESTFMRLFVGGTDVEHATACRERVLDELSKITQ